MAKRTYPAMLEPTDEGYGVSFPDLPGCVSFGDDIDHALAMAAEALSLHLEGMAEDGDAFPEATHLRDLVMDHPDRTPMSVWAAVTVEAPDSAERVNVYLAKSLLERIDGYCSRAGVNRSSFFNLAANRLIASDDERQRLERMAGAPVLARETSPFSLDRYGSLIVQHERSLALAGLHEQLSRLVHQGAAKDALMVGQLIQRIGQMADDAGQAATHVVEANRAARNPRTGEALRSPAGRDPAKKKSKVHG